MSNISAAEVAKLRKLTGAGMMDCKKALEEADGNIEKAIEIIRKKGQAIANKRADREAGEGAVLAKVSADGKYGYVTALNCETDFVAKNADFVALASSIIDIAIEKKPANLDELKALKYGDTTVGDKVLEQSGIIGEKVELSFCEKIEAEFVIPYIHTGNRLATLVGFNVAGVDIQVYKDVAMQVAAMNPVSVDKSDVPAKVIEQELEIGREQARRDGKPEEMIEKIAQGKLSKFYKESTLLSQEFVKDNKMTIDQYLKSKNKTLTVTKFIRFSLSI